MEFAVPSLRQSIRDLEYCNEDNRLYASDVICVGGFDEQAQHDFVGDLHGQAACDDIVEVLCNLENNFLNGVYACVRFFDDISPLAKIGTVELLCKILNQVLKHVSEENNDVRACFKLSVYLLAKLCIDEEERYVVRQKDKEPKNKGFQWVPERNAIVSVVLSSLKTVDFGKLWKCGLPEDSFLDVYWRLAEMLIVENPKCLTLENESMVQDLVCIPANMFHGVVSHVIVASFSHAIHKEEHFAGFVVSVMHRLITVYEDDKLTRDMILEVGRVDSHEASATIAKTMGHFIEILASSMPAMLLAHLSVVVPHLNAQAYSLRCSIVRALGELVGFLRPSENPTAETFAIQDDNHGTRNKLLDLIGERAHDTSSYVRGSCLGVLCSLAESGALPVSHIMTATEIAIERILDKSSIVRKNALSCLSCLLEHNPFSDRLSPLHFQTQLEELQKNEIAVSTSTEDDEDNEIKLSDSTLAALRYYKSALEFIARMEIGCKQAEQLIHSKITTDVSQSMAFLSNALRFQLPGASNSMRKLLGLIWDDRESGKIRKELLEAFELYYISEPVQVGRNVKRKIQSPSRIADNLIQLVSSATLAELTCIERILSELTCSTGILGRVGLPQVVIEHVWNVTTNEESSDDIVRVSLCIVALCTATPGPFFLKAHVSKLLDMCCIKKYDFGFIRYAFRILNHLKVEGYASSLEALVVDFAASLAEAVDDEQWYACCENAMCLLFDGIIDRPDIVCNRILRNAHKLVLLNDTASQVLYARFFFLLGHSAVKILVYTETVGSNAKKQTHETKSSSDDLGSMLSGGGDDYEDSVLRRISEYELVGHDTLMGAYVPMLLEIIQMSLTEEDAVDPVLSQSAVLALCKMMCISEGLCEQNLQLLFTVLRDSASPCVRSNIMISLGDLAVRFPNVVEPFTSQIYRRLRDPDTAVRKTSLMVLTHLILNDMIKVRGEVSEIAACLEDDENERIRDLACLFFHELSRKGNNPVYNLLPDTIHRLSKDVSISGKKFHAIAKFLTHFITAEKHLVSLVEKFCQRIFGATGLSSDSEQVEVVGALKEIKLIQDLAFTISNLKLSEKALKKLSDPLFKLYQPVLADEVVYTCMQNIMKKGKQTSKDMMEEWSSRMEQVREIQLCNQATTSKAISNKQKRRDQVNKENSR